MSLFISTIESDEYGKHYGRKKQELLHLGEGLSSGYELKGNVRAVADTVSFKHETDQTEIIWGWKFEQPVTILGGTIEVTNSVIFSDYVTVSLYQNDTEDSQHISILFQSLNTAFKRIQKELFPPSIFPDVPKGATVGFVADSGTIKTDVEINYSLIFSTTL